MEFNKQNVITALASVIDPESKKDIVSQNQVSDIVIDGNMASFTVSIASPALHSKKRMEDACHFAMERNFGKAFTAKIAIKSEAPVIDSGIPGVKHIIAVASGKGGVGKSTVTSNLAIGLKKKGYTVGIVDADVYGPSIPIMFNVAEERPASVNDGSNKMYPVDAYGIQIMSLGFFAEPDQPIVWRGAMVNKALKQLFFDTKWKDVDYLLIDLPPGTGDIHLSMVQSVPVSSAIMVTTPQNVAIADVRKGIAMFKLDNIKVPVLGIIENMSWFTPAELPENKYYIFGKDGGKSLADKVGLPLIGQIPMIQSIREAGDAGRPAIMQDSTQTSDLLDGIIDNVLDLQNKRLKNLPSSETVTMIK